MSSEPLVRSSRRGAAAVVELNVPQKRNLLSVPLVDALVAQVEAAEAEAGVRALVVTGAGSAFCAGADLKVLESAAVGDFASVRRIYDGFLRVRASPLLTIAAVNGPATGAGFNLALVCDLRYAARSAVFDSRFSAIHVHPGGGNAWLMTRAVGAQEAVLSVLLGESWSAMQALHRGLVAQVVDDERLIEFACVVANRLARHDRAYVARVLQTLRAASSGASHGEILEAEAEAQQWSLTQPNARAALAAARRRISSAVAQAPEQGGLGQDGEGL
jgi:enoyl-CoA hydratase